MFRASKISAEQTQEAKDPRATDLTNPPSYYQGRYRIPATQHTDKQSVSYLPSDSPYGGAIKSKHRHKSPKVAVGSLPPLKKDRSLFGGFEPASRSASLGATPRPVRPNLIRAWGKETYALVLALIPLFTIFILLGSYDGSPLLDWQPRVSPNVLVAILSLLVKVPFGYLVGLGLCFEKWSWFRRQSGPLNAFVDLDEASQGFYGCVLLLKSWNFRHWAVLGSWVVVGLLAVDSFIQASITYVGEAVPLAEGSSFPASTIARASKLDVGSWVAAPNEPTRWLNRPGILVNHYMVPDVGMSAAALFGFANLPSSTTSSSNPPSYRQATCRTGNCTWPVYSSLAVCSACADVSSSVVKHEGVRALTSAEYSGLRKTAAIRIPVTEYRLPYPYKGRTSLNIISPNSALLATSDDLGGLANGRTTLASGLRLSVVFNPSQTISFKNWTTMLASFAVIQPGPTDYNRSAPFKSAPIIATECAIQLCAKLYDTHMENGVLHETVLATTTERVPTSFKPAGAFESPAATTPTTTTTNPISGTWPTNRRQRQLILRDISLRLGNSLFSAPEQDAPYHDMVDGRSPVALLPRTDLQVRFPPATNNNTTLLPPDVQDTFTISQRSISTLAFFLGKTSTLDALALGLQAKASSSSLSSEGADSAAPPPPVDVAAAVANAAELLSNRMREADRPAADSYSSLSSSDSASSSSPSPSNNTTTATNATSASTLSTPSQVLVQGQTLRYTVFIRVRWLFLLYPVTIFLLGIVFSSRAVWDAREMGIYEKRRNILGVLLRGLKEDTRKQLQERLARGEEGDVGECWVRLLVDEEKRDGLSFELCESGVGGDGGREVV